MSSWYDTGMAYNKANQLVTSTAPDGKVTKYTSRPALCGASPWGGLAVRQYFRVAANHMPPQVLREGF
jgi:hypothetical protein